MPEHIQLGTKVQIIHSLLKPKRLDITIVPQLGIMCDHLTTIEGYFKDHLIEIIIHSHWPRFHLDTLDNLQHVIKHRGPLNIFTEYTDISRI